MIAVSVLFALAGLFAVGAIIAQRYQRERKPGEHERGSSRSGAESPAQSKPKPNYDEHPRVTILSSRASVIELSNHSAHLLTEVDRKRKASEEAIHKHKAILEELKVEEAKIRSGIEGESRLDDFLRGRLDDRWTIIAGYRAYEGEIDRILVGPKGVFAFEVKNLSGVIHCDGDRWWRDKTDRYGSVVERDIPIADNGGRSPSRQINDATDALEGLLEKNGHQVRIIRVVALAHPRASLGSLNGLAVDFCGTIPGLALSSVLARGTSLNAEQVRKIAITIRRHHEWFERKERQHPRFDEALSQVFSPSL